jgi:hypothetical protein
MKRECDKKPLSVFGLPLTLILSRKGRGNYGVKKDLSIGRGLLSSSTFDCG